MLSQEAALAQERKGVSEKYDASLGALVLLKRGRLEASWKALGEKVIHIRAGMVSLTGKLTQLQRTRDSLRRELEGKKRESIEISSKILTLDENLARLRKDVTESNKGLSKACLAEEQAKDTCNSLEQKVKDTKLALSQVSSAVQTLEGQLSRAGARKRLLEEMERSFEGYGKGPRTILTAKAQGALNGIVGAVGELFSCERKYVQALSAAVGGAAENVVVTDEEAAKLAIAYLKGQKGGRCTFLPLDLLKPRGCPQGCTIYRKLRSTAVDISDPVS